MATLYDGATLLKSESATLPSFVIGSTFTPSLVVNTTADNNTPFNPTNPDGTGSLRAAVESANLSSSSSPQIIQLGAGTYNLQSIYGSALSVTAQNLVIEGAGAGQTIINASGLGDRVFNVASGAILTLQGVTITGGSVGFTASGGGILNNGTLTLSDSSVTNNSSQDGGGGIANFGTLTVSDSEIEGNTTFNNGIGNLSLGGGIYNEGVATIVNSTIDNNLALDEGGGIYNVIGDLTVINSTIANNETVSNGGGISNEGFSVTVINSTIAGNSSAGAGGGIYDPQFTPTLLENTIVAGNYQAITPDDISGPVDSNSAYNLIGDSAGLSGISNGSNGNQIGQPNALLDPKLAPLGNYGGATKTMALLQGSPAINAGSNSLAANASLLTDQGGFSRDVGASVDIGAVEYQYDLSLNGHFATKDGALGTVQYVYTVANNGPDPVAGATLTVPLPQGMTLQSLTVPTGWTETDPGIGDNGTVAFTDTGSLNSGQSALFSIMGQLQNTTVGAALANTATVSPTASDNNPQNNSVTLTVTNEQEGQAFNNVKLFHFTDPNQSTKAIDFSASVAWSINNINTSGDGSGAVSVVADPNGGFDVLGSHIYAEEGVDGIVVSVSGLDGTVYTSNSQQLFQVADAPMTAGALTPPPNATINQAITNTVLFHFSDADPNGTASDYTATVTWADGSTNNSGDGSGNVSVVANSSGGFNVIGSHTYTQIVNPGTFRVQVSDAGGSSTSASDDTFQVLAPDQPLTAGALNVPSATTEGQSISNQVLFHFSDPDSNALPSDYLATVTWGDGSSNNSNDSSSSVAVAVNPNGGFDVIGSHTYGEGSGNYFAVKVTDLGDSSSTQPDLGGQFTGAVSSTPLTISDPPVTVTAGQSFSAVQNTLSRVQMVATFTDPGGPEPNATDPNQAIAPYIATIQWGDGAVTVASLTAQANYTNASVDSQGKITGQIASAANVGGIVLGSDGQTFSVNLAHQYANYGNYTITILLNHEGVLSTPVTTTAVVAGNDNLTATGGAPITSTFGASITNATVATFTDTNTVNPASEFTATITWGDGHSSAGTVSGGNGDFIVMGSHNYATAGNFPIGVTISNFGGTATATANTSATINPAAPTLTVSDVGGTYNGQPFPATGTALGVDGATPVSGSFSYAYYTSDTLLSAVPVHVGAYTVFATFTSSDPNYTGNTGQTTFTIAKATTGFTNLTVQQMTLRTATTTLSGQLTSNTILPVGQSVYITLNGVTKPATVGTTGNFSASFATSALGAGTYTISYSYAGDANFNAVTGTGSLTTTYNFSGFLAPLNSHLTLGLNRTIPIKFQLTDTNGNYVTSLSAVTSLQVLNSAGTDVLQGAGKTTLRYDSTANQFIYNWQTKGLSAGTYTIRLTLNDSSTYSLTVQRTASGNGANAQATDGSDVSGDPAGQLVGSDVELYVDNSNGDLTPDELARIQDAINAVDATTAPYGVAIDVVTDPTQADVTLNMSTNSAVGGYSQGILGCYTTSGAITLIQGWDWYAGADPTQVGANQYDFQTTVTHELGHALGLGESTTTTSAMYGTLAPGTVIRTLTTADLNVPYDEGGSDPQRAAVPPISTSASALPGGSAASFQGMTVPSIPGSGNPFSAADQVLADLALLLSNARNAYQSELSSAAALWQSADALAVQRLDALLSLQAGAMGVTKDNLMRDLLFAMMSSPNGV